MDLKIVVLFFISYLTNLVQSELYYMDWPNHFPEFKLNKGLDKLKSASFNSFARMLEILNTADAYNSQVDKYLKDKYKHNSFTKE